MFRVARRCISIQGWRNSGMSYRYMSSLVLGEIVGDRLSKHTYSAIEAAKSYGDISLWLCEKDLDERRCSQLLKGIDLCEVFYTHVETMSSFLPENRCSVLQSLYKEKKYDMICGSSSYAMKSLLARVSGLLEVPMLTDVTRIVNDSTFERSIYAGNVLSTVQLNTKPYIMTIRYSKSLEPQQKASSRSPVYLPLAVPCNSRFSRLEAIHEVHSDRPDLVTSKRVIVGGRGVGKKENMKSLYALADRLHAAVGGTRALVDMSIVESNLQVGQTGKIISPELYIGAGVSGSIQHQAGMKDAQTIVCINKDPEAPLFSISDLGIVGDLNMIIPEVLSKL